MTDTKALADRLESGRWRANDLPEAARILRDEVPQMEDQLQAAKQNHRDAMKQRDKAVRGRAEMRQGLRDWRDRALKAEAALNAQVAELDKANLGFATKELELQSEIDTLLSLLSGIMAEAGEYVQGLSLEEAIERQRTKDKLRSNDD